jgi:glycosyltransferase involved in cell wall biosynthesis
MKVAYFSVYRDGTGYSQAAIDNILAMQSAGIKIAARPVSMSNPNKSHIPSTIQEAEKEDLQNIDVVVQHCLPHTFEYKYGVKNIGYFDWETDSFDKSTWAACCNLMDEIWVPSLQNKAAAIKSGVKKPVKVIHHSCNVNKYNDEYEKLNIKQLQNKCIFYFIGEFTRRKNIGNLIRAFYSKFSSKDDVALLIKTNLPGKLGLQSDEYFKEFIEEIKNSIHLYSNKNNYPPVLIISQHIEDKYLNSIHSTGDIFVSASHGEGGCLPAMDAMGFGNPIIVPNWGFFPELCYPQANKYFDKIMQEFKDPGDIDCGWLVNGQMTYCFGMKDSIQELYTGTEQWFDPNIVELSDSMENAYNKWLNNSLNSMQKSAKERINHFSYEMIGNQMKKELES